MTLSVVSEVPSSTAESTLSDDDSQVGEVEFRTRLHRLLTRVRASCIDAVGMGFGPVSSFGMWLKQWIVSRLSASAEDILFSLAVWTFFISFSSQGVRNLLGMTGYILVIVFSTIAYAAVFIAAGRTLGVRRFSFAALGFPVVCCLSVFTSQFWTYTLGAGLGTLGTTFVGIVLAVSFPLDRFMDALLRAMQWTILVSLSMEVFVGLILQRRLAPVPLWGKDDIPTTKYWIDGQIFDGGPIQGFVGNRNPLAFIALILGICVVVKWIDGHMNNLHALAWLGASVLTLALTRSATVSVAAVVCSGVLAAFCIMRKVPEAHQVKSICIAVASGSVASFVAFLFRADIAFFLGREPDMTGRSEIWDRVLNLWSMHPLAGWGWVIYWPSSIPMFRYLVVRPDGTPTASSHNAWIEALFQTGVVGFAVLVVCVAWVAFHTFVAALRNMRTSSSMVLPAVLMTAMLIQSLSESRLLSEGNWILFVAFATWLTVRVDPDETMSTVFLGASETRALALHNSERVTLVD